MPAKSRGNVIFLEMSLLLYGILYAEDLVICDCRARFTVEFSGESGSILGKMDTIVKML